MTGRTLFLTFAMKGNTMSHTNTALSISFNGSTKVNYREYLRLNSEPVDNAMQDGASDEINVGLLKDSFDQKRKLRSTARRLRQTHWLR